MKTAKTVTNILSAAVYICILGFLAIAAPMVAGYRPVVVLSGSMEPTYGVGSVIYYKSVPFEQIQVGDPITFRGSEGGAMVTHRVVEKDESARAFGTEGDANGSRDPGMVPYENVVGRATQFCIPYAGYFVNFGKQPASIAVLAVILASGMIVDHMAGDDKKEKSGKSGKEAAPKDAEETSDRQ
ncbi:MAG: signal peptidase I [Hungatella sp.]|nr:signal peptidase I [Hungatella sp.]